MLREKYCLLRLAEVFPHFPAFVEAHCVPDPAFYQFSTYRHIPIRANLFLFSAPYPYLFLGASQTLILPLRRLEKGAVEQFFFLQVVPKHLHPSLSLGWVTTGNLAGARADTVTLQERGASYDFPVPFVEVKYQRVKKHIILVFWLVWSWCRDTKNQMKSKFFPPRVDLFLPSILYIFLPIFPVDFQLIVMEQHIFFFCGRIAPGGKEEGLGVGACALGSPPGPRFRPKKGAQWPGGLPSHGPQGGGGPAALQPPVRGVLRRGRGVRNTALQGGVPVGQRRAGGPGPAGEPR